MRVLISAESFLPRSNGVTNSVLQLSRFLLSQGHDLLVIASGDGPEAVGEIQVKRVPALALKTIAQVDIPKVKTKTLLPILEEFKPDIIYLASPFLLGNQVRKAAALVGVPVVANYQTDVSGFMNYYGLTAAKAIVEKRLRKIHKKSTMTLAPSTSSIEYLRSLDIENIRYWGRGVDLVKFNPKWRSEKLRKSWGADSETMVIGYVGRLAPEKQVHKIGLIGDVGAIAGVKTLQVIVGDGPTRERLQKELPDAIFTGQLGGDDLSKAMASMDLLVTTGENETFCQVIQEAMAAGLPVIAPKAGGPIDLIEDGKDGFFYQPGENTSIRRIVLKALANPAGLTEMSHAARNKVAHKTWENICLQLSTIFSEVIEQEKLAKYEKANAS